MRTMLDVERLFCHICFLVAKEYQTQDPTFFTLLFATHQLLLFLAAQGENPLLGYCVVVSPANRSGGIGGDSRRLVFHVFH
jgi:hypothetical protein